MLGQLLMYTFRERYGTLLLRAFTTRDREAGALLLTREEEERTCSGPPQDARRARPATDRLTPPRDGRTAVYEVAREATRTFELWRRSSGCRIQASALLKRKRKLPIGAASAPPAPRRGAAVGGGA